MRGAQVALEDLPAEGADSVTNVDERQGQREVVNIGAADGGEKLVGAEAGGVGEAAGLVDEKGQKEHSQNGEENFSGLGGHA